MDRDSPIASLIVILDVGKFLNGYNVVNANITPKGWDHVDASVSLLARFDSLTALKHSSHADPA